MSDRIPKSFDAASREVNAACGAWRLSRIMSEFVEATEREILLDLREGPTRRDAGSTTVLLDCPRKGFQ